MRLPWMTVFAAGVLGMSGAAAYYELAPYFTGGTDSQARYQALVDGDTVIGISSFSHRVVLNGCLEATNSIYGRLQSAERRNAVIAHCRAEAADITERTPSNGFAWLMLARLAGLTGDITEMNRDLAMSRATAPFEQWVAELRVDLAENRLADLSPENQAGNNEDLAMLVQTRRGIATIAHRYVREQDFRQRITDIVETLPEEDQARFVDNVRAVARDAGLL